MVLDHRNKRLNLHALNSSERNVNFPPHQMNMYFNYITQLMSRSMDSIDIQESKNNTLKSKKENTPSISICLSYFSFTPFQKRMPRSLLRDSFVPTFHKMKGHFLIHLTKAFFAFLTSVLSQDTANKLKQSSRKPQLQLE